MVSDDSWGGSGAVEQGSGTGLVGVTGYQRVPRDLKRVWRKIRRACVVFGRSREVGLKFMK